MKVPLKRVRKILRAMKVAKTIQAMEAQEAVAPKNTAAPKPTAVKVIKAKGKSSKARKESTVDKWGVDWSKWRVVNLTWNMTKMIVPASAEVWTPWEGKQWCSKAGFKPSEWEDHGSLA